MAYTVPAHIALHKIL